MSKPESKAFPFSAASHRQTFLLCSFFFFGQSSFSVYSSPSLQVLETCVKNCGHRFHVQVANRDFIDGVLVKIISPKTNPPTIVQDKVLSLIQVSELSLFCQWWSLGSQVGTVCFTSQVLYHRLQPLMLLSCYLRSALPTGGILCFSSRCPLNIYRHLLKDTPRDTPLLDTFLGLFTPSLSVLYVWEDARDP